MANLNIGNIISLGSRSDHTATSWQVSKDSDFSIIIDESLSDKVNLHSWTTPLPNPEGGFYGDLDEVYARFKIHFERQESDWILISKENQNTQPFTYRYPDGTTESYAEGELIIN